MKNYVLRQAALLVAAVLLTTNFWSCSKDEEPVPEPTPPVVSVTSVTLNKTATSIQVGGTETPYCDNITNRCGKQESDMEV